MQNEKGSRECEEVKDKIESDAMGTLSFLAVITGTEYAYTRKDGIHVIPLGCLKD